MRRALFPLLALLLCAVPALAGVEINPGPGALVGGATIGESLGPELLTQTCAGWGLTAPVGAWSCSGGTITRTASGSNLTITNTAAAVGTEYKVCVTYATITAGTFSATVGGVAQVTHGTAGAFCEYILAGTTGAVTITAVAASAGTITVSATSVKAKTDTITPASGPVIVQKTFANATANEAGLVINTNQTGAGGDKTSLEINQTGSGTGAEYLINAKTAGSSMLSLTGAGALTVAGTILASNGLNIASGYSLGNNTNFVGPLNINSGAQNAATSNVHMAYGTFSNTTGTAVGVDIKPTFGSPTATSGTDIALQVSPTHNRSSTGSSVDLQINRVETALGSGTQKFLSLQSGAAGTTEVYSITNRGHVAVKANAVATATSAGALATGSNDHAGKITTVGGTSAAVTFAYAYTNTPACVVSSGKNAVTVYVSAASNTSFTVSASADPDIINYHCIGLGE